MAPEVIVLGGSGTYPVPGSACSSFLLRSEGSVVWIDAGPGSFANLQRHVHFQAVSALVISHLHLDHILDVYPFYYALRWSRESRGPAGLEVYAPAGAEAYLSQLTSPSGDGDFGGYFAFRTISDGDEHVIDSLHFRFARSVHPVETMAMRARVGERVLAYTSDTGLRGASDPDGRARLVALASDADLLIAEATMQEPVPELEEVHMTAREAGELAAEAGAARLMLTHLWPGLDPSVSVAAARQSFGGEVITATDNLRLEI
ncbi:MAG: MBL fold metallo-hydrolase [Actinomycetota bacterium]